VYLVEKVRIYGRLYNYYIITVAAQVCNNRKEKEIRKNEMINGSVQDPNPDPQDPYVFGPPDP
jgi:hypothetical protein